MPSKTRYLSRSQLASRHVTAAVAAVRRARNNADSTGDFGLDDDLCQIETELLRVQQSLWQAGGLHPSRPQIPGTQKLPGT
jgi:hypothetical protein